MGQGTFTGARALALLGCVAVLALGCGTRAPAPSPGATSTMASMTASSGPGFAAPPVDPSAEAATLSRDLRFRGTVAAIDATHTDELSNRKWVVTMNVERILAGEFIGKTFAFRIHSPSKSGLVVGGSYTVEAKWTGDGYRVDQFR
jgi:hypothetical protein